MKNWRLILYIVLLGTISCRKAEVEPNDEELITTLKLNFEPINGGPSFSYQFDDADGPGGSSPITDSIRLSTLTTYRVSLQLFNKTTYPVTELTAEVQEEAEAHRFYYEPVPQSSLTVTNLDTDINGIPIGVTSTWTSGNVNLGTIKITLRHYGNTPPNKDFNDPVDSPKSDTDIEIVFPLTIQ